MKIYLAGPINGCTDGECKDWRQTCTRRLRHACVDPMRRDYRGKEAGSVAAIVEDDKADIDGCDVLLVYYSKPSVGTSMEVLYAWERQKRVMIVDAGVGPLSPWLLYHSSQTYGSLDEAIEALNATP